MSSESFYIPGPVGNFSEKYLAIKSEQIAQQLEKAHAAYKNDNKTSDDLNALLFNIAAMVYFRMHKELAPIHILGNDWAEYERQKQLNAYNTQKQSEKS